MNQDPQLVMISLDDFEKMEEQFDTSISRDVAGLDDLMLKKLLLAYNAGNYSEKATIIIELEGGKDTEDIDGDGNKEELTGEVKAISEDPTLAGPFTMKQGKDIEQFKVNVLENISNGISGWFSKEDKDSEIDEKKKKHNKYYLCSTGTLIFKYEYVDEYGNKREKELNYLNEEVLTKLYENEYIKKKDGANPDYAESVWEFLGTCYTDGVNGIKMYSHEEIKESITQWHFKDDELIDGMTITRTTASSISKERTIQNIEINSLVGEYTTPLEFMVNLLEISSSKEFVDAFIDKVVNETSITLKVYKTGQSHCEEIKEEMQENTHIKAEIKVDAKLDQIQVKILNENGTVSYKWLYQKDWASYGVNNLIVKSKSEDASGFIDKVKRTVTITNVPSNVSGVYFKLYKGDGVYEYILDYTEKTDSNGNIYYEYSDTDAFVEKYKTKTNECIITTTTSTITTESKYDIAIEEVDTWYAKISFDNILVTDIEYDTVGANGNLVSKTTEVENGTEPEDAMIMNPGTKATEVYTKNDTNKDTIFKEDTVENLKATQLSDQMNEWHDNLTSDNLFYYLTGGPISRLVKGWIDEGNTLHTNDDCVHVKLTYAMSEGVFDSWFRQNYTPIEITSEYTSYSKGKLITSINTYLQEPIANDPVDKFEFFLSLLKNNNIDITGKARYKEDASYGLGPGFSEVYYKDVYGDDVRVAKLILSAEEMFYELLEQSQNTQGLVGVMRAILARYQGDGSISIKDVLDLENVKDELAIIGEEVDEKLWCSLINLGLTKEQAASVMGNVAVDCGFNEVIITKTNKEEVGLCKWYGTRRVALQNYAKSKGVDINNIDVNTQIQFLVAELTEGGNAFAKYQLDNVQYGGTTYTVDSWKNGTDVGTMAETFAYIFKKPETALTDISTRKNKATEYYNKFKDYETVNDIIGTNTNQNHIVEVAKNYSSYGIEAEEGMCLRWVKQVYQQVIGTYASTDCAFCSGHLYGVSTDFSIVPVGAAVYGESSTDNGYYYGHVGIYIGNGQVMDNIGYIRTISLKEWIAKYPDGCWGWVSSTPINEAYPITEGLIHKGRHS